MNPERLRTRFIGLAFWRMALVVIAIHGCGGQPESDDDDASVDTEAVAGQGLTGKYYEGTAFNTLFTPRVDAQVDFNWAKGAPVSGMTIDSFSVEWKGYVQPPVSGTYSFTTTSDDGVRLWVNGTKLVDNWTNHAATDNSGTIQLTAGTLYSIKLDYYEAGGNAVARLSWTPPGQAKQVIPSSALRTSAPTATGISIANHHLTRDGQPWIPKGLSMIGALTCGSANTAFAHWGAAEIAAAKSWGADSFRFQVSQPFLDPQSSKYSASYLQRVQDMVALAKSQGFAVILSMQDQSLACGNADPTPTASTQRAWNRLGPAFANDSMVIYELYNEPQTGPDAAGWAKWLNGGSGAVGHQALLDQLRGLGAKNVILADGANHAEILTGVPLLSDPLNKVGYAVHPYYMAAINFDPLAWDKRFGNLSNTQVVVATEWDADSATGGCAANDPELTAKLLPYLQQHGIGIYGWAFDLPNTLIKDWSWTPTNFDQWVCGQGNNGAGQALRDFFLAHSAAAPLSSQPALVLASADFAATSSTKWMVQAELSQNAQAKLIAVGDLSYTSPYADNYPWNQSGWLAKTFPVMGNHEFNTVAGKGGQEPYALFNGDNAAGNRTFPAITGNNGVQTFDFAYSYQVAPGWLLVVVNTSNNFSTQSASSQATKLGTWVDNWRNSLGGHGCVMVAMHTARWSTTFSGYSDNGPEWANGTAPIWNAAVNHHVDILLQGHVHAYEEFVRLDAAGNASSSGVKLFTVGSGGRGQVKIGSWSNIDTSKRLDYHASPVNGILKLGLYPGSYGYKFETSAASPGTPASSKACHIS